MLRQIEFRRIALGLAVAALALVTMFGNGANVGATQNDDWGSKADFQWFCELVGGTYFESPQDGLTICVYPDGTREACDMNGGDCYSFPPPRTSNTGSGRLDSVKAQTGNAGAFVESSPTPTIKTTRIDRATTLAIDERD
jgi:hypothetical protein